MEKPKKKTTNHIPGPYSFCPKHNVFFVSCGCPPKKADKKKEDEDIEH